MQNGVAMEGKLVHLEMIQAVITRMAGNSFLLKGWSVTLISALFALAASDSNLMFVYLAYFPAFTFWMLDAYFLRQERLFRKLYDHVTHLSASEVDYSMNTSPFDPEVEQQLAVAFSPTLRLFHGTITGTIIIIMISLMLAK